MVTPRNTLVELNADVRLVNAGASVDIRVARHAHNVLDRHDLAKAGAKLVIDMADVPGGNGRKPRKHTSLASKFCQFFVDAEHFQFTTMRRVRL
jgi:hypothetical protein